MSAGAPTSARYGGFDEEAVRRYSRAIVLPEVGGAGQRRLLAASVALAGAGIAARVAATYLAGAGVGTLRIEGADGSLVSDLADLNPGVRVAVETPGADDRLVCVDARPPAGWTGPWLHGAIRGRRLSVSYFPGPGVWDRAHAPASADDAAPAAQVLLGTLIATEAQLRILGLRPADEAESRVLDLESYGAVRLVRDGAASDGDG